MSWFTEQKAKFEYRAKLTQLMMQLRSSSEGAREKACRELGTLGDISIVEKIIPVLKDKSPGVRRAAATALGTLGDPRAVDPLVAAIRDPRQNVRKDIVGALAKLENSRAIDTLVQAVRDPDPDVRKLAIEGVIKLGKMCTEQLLGLLQDHSDPIRRETIRALGEIGDARAIQPLVNVLNASNVDSPLAAAALERLGWSPMDGDERVLYAFARGRSDDVVGDGLRSVGPLITQLKNIKNTVRRAAAHALGEIGDPAAVPSLIVALKDEAADVREEAARALGTLKDGRAVDALVPLFTDDNAEAREAAVHAMGVIADIRGMDALIKATRSPEHHLRAAAAAALGQMDDPRTVEPLMMLLTDKRHNVRKAASDALVKQGASVVDAMLSSLSHSDPYARVSAAEALGQLADPGAIHGLTTALRDPHELVRRESAKALGYIKDAQAVPALTNAMRDENMEVRQAATRALGEICDITAVPCLLAAVHDTKVAEAALGSLAAILQQHAAELDVDAYRALATLPVIEQEYGEYDNLLGEVIVTREVESAARFRDYAVKELARRGITLPAPPAPDPEPAVESVEATEVAE